MHQFDNAHAERAAVASILQNPEFLGEMSGNLDLAAFKNPANRAIIQLATQLFNSGYSKFDRELLQNRIVLTQVPGVDSLQMQNYVSALLSADIESSNFENYVRELKQTHLKDSLTRLLHKSIEDLESGDASSVLGAVQTGLYELDVGINKNDDATDVCQHVNVTLEKLATKPDLGIPTGISLLDDIMLGWLPKKFYFVGARPGEGKSAFLLQATSQAAFFSGDRGAPVLYIDTEMDDEEFEIRLLGHLAGVDSLLIKQGKFLEDEQTRQSVMKAKEFMNRMGGIYHIEMPPPYELSDVVNLMRRYVYNFGVGLIVFDQIEEPADDTNRRARWEMVGLLGRTLKQQAQRLNVPVLAALQQNKKGADKSRVTSEAYAESDDVFKKADGALALNRKTAEEIKKETIHAGTHRLQILKGRYHGTLFGGMNLRYIKYCLQFWPARIQATENVEEDEHANEEAGSDIPTAMDYAGGPLIP